MREKDKLSRKSIIKGVLYGLFILVIGFGVMYGLWIKIGTMGTLKGFFDYRAATIGDGICLPLMLGSLVAFEKYNEAIPINKKRAMLCGAIFAVIGIGIQYSWLASDGTELNWTIPAQHVFNAAGWYHSLFFIMMFGLIAYHMNIFWIILKNKSAESLTWFEKNLLLIFVMSGSLFLMLFLKDDYGKYLANGYLFSVASLCILFILCVFARTASGKENYRDYIFSITIGIISAFGVAMLLCMQGEGSIAFAVSGALGTCYLWRIGKFSTKQLVFMNIWMLPVAYALLYAYSALNSVLEMLCIFGVLLLLNILYEVGYLRVMETRTLTFISIGAYILFGALGLKGKYAEGFIKLAFLIGVYIVFKKEIIGSFNEVKKAESRRNYGKIENRKFVEVKGCAYLQIIEGIIALSILLLEWILSIAQANRINIEIGRVVINTPCLLALVLLFGGIIILGIKNIRRSKVSRLLIMVFVTIFFVLLVADGIWGIKEVEIAQWALHKKILLGFSIFANIGCAILLAHGYYMNLVLLRGLKHKRDIKVMAGILFVGYSSIVALTTIQVLEYSSLGILVAAIVKVSSVAIIIPVLSARVMQYEYCISKIVPNTPLGGVAQDGMMILMIVLFAIYLPDVYCGVTNWNTADSESFFNVLVGLVSIISGAFLPVGFCLKNNVGHLSAQYQIVKEQENGTAERERWDILHECIVRQSWQTVFAMLPYVIVVVIGKFGGQIIRSIPPSQIKNNLLETYIDKKTYQEDKREKNQDEYTCG